MYPHVPLYEEAEGELATEQEKAMRWKQREAESERTCYTAGLEGQ